MLGEVFDIDFAEGTKSAVYGQVVGFDSLDFEALEQFSTEVRTGGRGHYGAFLACKDGLVAFGVFGFGVAFDVVGQGRHAQVVELFLEFVVRCVVQKA